MHAARRVVVEAAASRTVAVQQGNQERNQMLRRYLLGCYDSCEASSRVARLLRQVVSPAAEQLGCQPEPELQPLKVVVSRSISFLYLDLVQRNTKQYKGRSPRTEHYLFYL